MTSFQQALLAWFGVSKRNLPWRHTDDPWAIWVSEVMLQQTRVDTVIPYYKRFLKAFPSPFHLAKAPLDDVLKQWEGLGYYARARNLQFAAKQVVQQHGGCVPTDPTAFEALKGVGPYILAAVQSIAFNHPLAAVDGNVKRVIARIQGSAFPVNAPNSHSVYQPLATDLLNKKAAGDHNQAMMELGATICTPSNPRCTQCPVMEHCLAFQKDVVSRYPVRLATKKVPTHRIVVGVVKKGSKLLICKRKEDGLLGGLWEFPGGKVEPDEPAQAACIREIREEVNLEVKISSQLTTVHHAYTHFKIIMDVYMCHFSSGRVRLRGPVEHAWVLPNKLSDYAFPKANHKFIPLLHRALAELQD